jgi:hypothetical protein
VIKMNLSLKRRLNDKRVKKILVVDVETLGLGQKKEDEPKYIYDLGVVLTDKLGNVYIKKSWLIQEIFNSKDVEKAYYYSKPKWDYYNKQLAEGETKLVSWHYAINEIKKLIVLYDIKQVSAFNLPFDREAFYDTNRFLNGKFINFFNTLEQECIRGLACETLGQQKTYQRLALDNNLRSKSGQFLLTTAEAFYKYITNDYTFIEAHTGLQDALIETEIMARCYKVNNKRTRGRVRIRNNPHWLLEINDKMLSHYLKYTTRL